MEPEKWMEEILHHLRMQTKTPNGMDNLSNGAGFLPSTVLLVTDFFEGFPSKNGLVSSF